MEALTQFREAGCEELFMLLTSQQLLSRDEADAVVHALVDTSESIDKIYSELIPKILQDPAAGRERLQDRLWDIREEFGHIDYHIHDGGLTVL